MRPLDPMTRAEAAAVFYRLMTATFRAASREGSHSFSDVDPAAWYGAAVSTCASAGIVFGYEDGSYRPGQLITRAEFTAFAAALLLAGSPAALNGLRRIWGGGIPILCVLALFPAAALVAGAVRSKKRRKEAAGHGEAP